MHSRRGAGDLLDILHALRRFQDGMDEKWLLQPMLRFQLCEKLVKIMDVPGPFDLGQHDDVELGADFGDKLRYIVEHPGAVQRIDADPESGGAKIVALADFDHTAPGRILCIGRNSVFEIAEQHVDLRNDVPNLCPDLFVVPGEEVDHALQRHGQFPVGRRRTDCERLVKISRKFHGYPIGQGCSGRSLAAPYRQIHE